VVLLELGFEIPEGETPGSDPHVRPAKTMTMLIAFTVTL
jgi:hypothetical protein